MIGVNSHKDIETKEILQKISDGNIRLFENIIREKNHLLYSIGKTYQLNHEHISLLMKDVYFEMYQEIKNHQIFNFTVQMIQKMNQNCQTFITNDSNKKNMRPSIQASNNSQNISFNDVVENAISSLPLDYRLIYTLIEINQLTLDEVALIVKKKENEVIETLQMAKIRLQEIIHSFIQPTSLFEFNLIHCDDMVNNVMDRINKDEQNN